MRRFGNGNWNLAVVQRRLGLVRLRIGAWFGLAAVGLLACGGMVSVRAAEAAVTNRFGFSGKEIFPIDQQIGHLRAADLDGDGLQDLVVVNNARSKISLLYNQTGRTNAFLRPAAAKRELNQLPPDSRFHIESIASEKRISSMVVDDLNGDGRPDLAYYGEPKELVVQFNEGTNTWSAPRRWQLDDGLLNPNALVQGDLNGDGRVDLLLLAEGFVYWLPQNEKNTLSEPEKIPYSGSIQAVQVLDIQGDGRDDLLVVNWDNPNPFRFRLQNKTGQLGPEIHFSLPSIRSYWADDLDHDHQTEVITIAHRSGRAQISNFAQRPAEPISGEWRRGQFQVMPLMKSSKAKRGVTWADLNGDSRTDLIVSNPDSGQVAVHLQQENAQLAAPRTFAALTGISDLSVADWDGDGKPELFVLSQDERQVGVTRMDENGKVTFPGAVTVLGRPLVMTAGMLRAEGAAVLVVIADIEGKRELQIISADGKVRRQLLSASFKSNPKSVAIHDVNQDGLADVVVLVPYENIKVLLQVAEKDFNEQDIIPPGGTAGADQPWLSVSDVDGDGKAELLLAQRNFLRAVVLQHDSHAADEKSGWTFAVKEQINGAASNSRIVAAAALKNGTNAIASIFMLDAERKALTVSERTPAGVWQVGANIPLPVTDFTGLQAIGLGASEPNTIAFLGNNSVAWQHLSGEVWQLVELDGYESPIKDAFLHDVVSGDLNQDNRKDLVFLETGKSYIDVVTFEAPHQLVPANRWQVFELRTFRSRRTESAEPREALVVDLNNDKKNDLAVVVHDRVIIYLQE